MLQLEKFLKKAFSWQYIWELKSFFKWEGIEIEDFRKFENWDDQRQINRKISAKKWETFLNIYKSTKNVDIYMYLDINQNWFWWYDIKNIDKIYNIIDYILEFARRNWANIAIVYYIWKKRVYYKLPKNSWANFFKKKILSEFKTVPKKYISNLSNFLYLEKKISKKHVVFIFSDFLDIDWKNLKDIKSLKEKNELFLMKLYTQNAIWKNFMWMYVNELELWNRLKFFNI